MNKKETASSRVWFFPTSPRSPYKIRAELELLQSVSHLPWSRAQGQAKFAALLAQAKNFQGEISAKEPTFSARDRTRAPKILGLVEQNGKGENATIALTGAGERFLTLSESEEAAFFLNQIAKVQFPSAQHSGRNFESMSCRPLTITLAIMLRIGSLTKEEFGLFVLPCVNASEVEVSVNKLTSFRETIKKDSPGLGRKKKKKELIDERIKEIYAKDIEAGKTLLREGGTNFVLTKTQTLRDYADSSFRYLLATGLFRIEPHGKTFSLLESKKKIAADLIKDLGLDSTYDEYNPRTYTSHYLGNPREPAITLFSKESQTSRLLPKLETGGFSLAQVSEIRKVFSEIVLGFERENFLNNLDTDQKIDAISKQSAELVKRRAEVTPEILQMFKDITSKEAELIDRPLFLEWNTWRALTTLNDALEVVGNFRCDTDGNPLGTASGKQSDIVAEYKDFWLAVEVTLMSGHKQYEAESESIVRHVGKLQAERIEKEDARPVFGLFIAPKINETVVNYLMTTARMKSKIYKGPVRIAPLPLEGLQHFLACNQMAKFTSSQHILELLSSVFEEELLIAGDEPAWLEKINDKFSALSISSPG
jgi:hypothetical protein